MARGTSDRYWGKRNSRSLSSSRVPLVYPSVLPYNEFEMRKRKAASKRGSTLYIKNPAAHRLAEQVSKRMGVTLSDAVVSALEEKIQKTGRPLNRARLDALCAKIGSLPVLDSRTPDEILGYDEFGIPR